MYDETVSWRPGAAFWLGWAGVLPFLGATGALALGWRVDWAVHAFVAYGAVILSFLGGIRWGQVVLDPEEGSALQLKLAVLPSLLGWLALLLPGRLLPITLLAIGFALMLWLDVFSKLALGPDRFRLLRLQLSTAVLLVHLGVIALLLR